MAGLSLRCGDCGALLKSVEEAQEHAELTKHSNFSESTEAVLNLVCATCGKPCRSRTVRIPSKSSILLPSCLIELAFISPVFALWRKLLTWCRLGFEGDRFAHQAHRTCRFRWQDFGGCEAHRVGGRPEGCCGIGGERRWWEQPAWRWLSIFFPLSFSSMDFVGTSLNFNFRISSLPSLWNLIISHTWLRVMIRGCLVVCCGSVYSHLDIFLFHITEMGLCGFLAGTK